MANIVGMGVDDTNNLVFAWFDDGTVTAGSSKNLSSKRSAERYQLPSGKKPQDIVEMAIDGTNNLVFAWYRDKTVSAGSSRDLASKRKPEPYKLPEGKTPADIIGMGIDGKNNLVFAWYRDNTVSAGSSRDLTSKRAPAPYKLPEGKTPADVVGMDIDGLVFDKPAERLFTLVGEGFKLFSSNGDQNGKDNAETADSAIKVKDALSGLITELVFAWYRDGTVSAGSSRDLFKLRPPYNYVR
jgi:hypothetical protein